MESIKKLEEQGLHVTSVKEGWYKGGYFIDKCGGKNVDLNREELLLHTKVYPIKDKWFFELWHSLDDPTPDEFRCVYDSLDIAVENVYDFYFGKPLIIDGWQIPLHKHPELKGKDILIVLKNAKKVTLQEFNLVIKEYQEMYLQKIESSYTPIHSDEHNDEYLDALYRYDPTELDISSFIISFEENLLYQFIEIINNQNNDLLMLRRDLLESFIVIDSKTLFFVDSGRTNVAADS